MPEAVHPITEAIALRIGLAARALPDVEPQRLIQAILDALKGETPNPINLQALTVRRLKESLSGELAEQPNAQLKEAVAYLRGEIAVTEMAGDLPTPAPYEDGDMPASIRVALASNAGQSLDGHFGTCVRFLIYQVSPTETRLVEVRRAENGRTEDMDKNDLRAEQLRDCDLLYVVSIGGPAAAKVVRRDIHPVKKPAGGEARIILAELQGALAAPPPWLAKAMGRTYAHAWEPVDD
ncbi:NifB/NifX family molybdenum-iron cluster-binding protein [Oleispirillum naphthae]|uniref:NifB/NifX family molybdenum-iron cluster-binding protein n=1 Tax=Oleispirillum naphthae TaxID=2838853 RepID=UPI0030826947